MKSIFNLLTALLLLPLASIHAAAKPAKSNIIVIFTDDQTYRGIGYNNPEVKTPHLDTLAAGGITFERAYVASPICAASRALMLTGRFPEQHGLRALDSQAFAPFRTGGPQAQQTLPSRLNEAGYTTALFGKSHLGEPRTYGFAVGDEIGGRDDVEILKRATEFIKMNSLRFAVLLAPLPHRATAPKKQSVKTLIYLNRFVATVAPHNSGVKLVRL